MITTSCRKLGGGRADLRVSRFPDPPQLLLPTSQVRHLNQFLYSHEDRPLWIGQLYLGILHLQTKQE